MYWYINVILSVSLYTCHHTITQIWWEHVKSYTPHKRGPIWSCCTHRASSCDGSISLVFLSPMCLMYLTQPVSVCVWMWGQFGLMLPWGQTLLLITSTTPRLTQFTFLPFYLSSVLFSKDALCLLLLLFFCPTQRAVLHGTLHCCLFLCDTPLYLLLDIRVYNSTHTNNASACR